MFVQRAGVHRKQRRSTSGFLSLRFPRGTVRASTARDFLPRRSSVFFSGKSFATGAQGGRAGGWESRVFRELLSILFLPSLSTPLGGLPSPTWLTLFSFSDGRKESRSLLSSPSPPPPPPAPLRPSCSSSSKKAVTDLYFCRRKIRETRRILPGRTVIPLSDAFCCTG